VAKKKRNYHIGGEQIPLIVPDSAWGAPSELPDLRGRVTCIAEDTETKDDGLAASRGPGWPYRSGYLCGVSWAWRTGTETQSIYVPVRHPDTECFDPDNVKRWMRDHRKVVKHWVYQSAPYDLGWTKAEWGLEPPQEIEDTSLQAFMVDENRLSYKLDDLCRWRGIEGKDETLLREVAAAYGYEGEIKQNLWRLPARFVGPYAEQDAIATLLLRDNLEKEIVAQDMVAAYQLECELIPLILEMRRRGIRIDVDGAHRLREELNERRDSALAELSKRLGGRALSIEDVRSPKVVESWFAQESVSFQRTAGRTLPDGTRAQGQIQVDSDWMRHHAHWLPRSVAVIKQLTEMSDKFVQNYVIDFLHRGRIHAQINQWKTDSGGTRSHRLSYSDPPLQQAPSRPETDWPLTGELAHAFRRLFLPEEGETWLAADYSQQEIRLIVHVAEGLRCTGASLAGDRFRTDPKTDFHSYVAEITELPRRDAKDASFAKSYGAGIPKFSTMIKKSIAEAAQIYKQYDEEMPFVKQLAEKCKKKADQTGIIRLLDGARSHFDFWEPAWREKDEPYEPPRPLSQAKDFWGGARWLRRGHTHKAMNRKIQGDAARQTKKAMLNCWKAGITPMLQMHDEIDFSVTNEKTGKQIQEIMVNAVRLRVPMLADCEYGSNWAEAKHTWKERNGSRHSKQVATKK
jgi:DNA polymerase I-like protein with 3'-5' exonuclease and polymerase domains